MAGDDSVQFNTILTNLLSVDNEIRTKSEEALENIPVENRIGFLLRAVSASDNSDEICQLAAVLLRRLISTDFEDISSKLSVDALNQLKNQLLINIQQDVSPVLRKKVCDAAAELARNLIDDDGNNHWPEFLKFLFDCASSSNLVLRESALQMFTAVPGIFGNQQGRYLEIIHQMLIQSLQEPATPQVKIAAVKATTAFLVAHEKENNIHRHFADCLPHLLQVLSQSFEQQDDDSVLKCFVDLAESCPRYLRSQLAALLQLCTKAVSETDLTDSFRHLALEIVVTLSETAPGMIRKLGSKHIVQIVPQIFAMMMDVEEEPDWVISEDVDDEDNDTNPAVGESSLDRLACSLGGKSILPLVINCLPQMLGSPDWRQRHAGLMAVSAVGEGCHKQMEALLGQIVEGVLPYLQDSHPRVRYAACNCIGQMATDFAPIFEKKFHDKVIPGLLLLLDDNANPRVQAHAGAALVNFFEDCPKNVLNPYLDSIVDKLETVLSSKFKELVEKGTKLVLEQMVVTLASVADTAEEKFIKYYDRFMPCLKYIIENATSQELRLLRGKTIECVSLIGLAVGREKFVVDASGVMDMLLKTQTDGAILTDDDPQLAYMISAWARICKILGKQFEPYLPYVMGPVLKAASLKPEIALLDSEDMKVVEGDDDWQFVSLGEQQNFGIRTAGLEEKATACQMLVCYARELKESFAPYVEEVVKLMVPMLKFYFHDGVRVAAAEGLPFLLECARIRGDAYLVEMWRYICPELLRAIDTEPEKEVLSDHMHALAQCIEVLGQGCLIDEHMNEVIRILDKKLKEHFERAQERQEKRKDEDYDEMVEEILLDEDDEDVYLLSKVADILHALFASYKQEFFPYFDHLLPHFIQLSARDRPWSDHQWALCVFDDVIEHGGPACSKYQEYFMTLMMDSLTDNSPEVRQAAAYGVGVLGQHGGEGFAKACSEFIPRLAQMINAPDSRTPENVNATENAIAAVTKILSYNSSQVSVEEIIPHWLSWLPVWEDEDEAPHVYGFLCTLLEQSNHILLGPDNCNLPRIIMVMSEIFLHEAIKLESDVGKRMLNLLRLVQSNAEVFSECIRHLSPQQQEALHKVLTIQ
uniref:Importin-5 n=1 Tax=Hadrurus spadix TaxID=141984 RepID=A0A1W7RAB9_9SCOR